MEDAGHGSPPPESGRFADRAHGEAISAGKRQPRPGAPGACTTHMLAVTVAPPSRNRKRAGTCFRFLLRDINVPDG